MNCPNCDRADCPTLTIPDPTKCTHEPKHWTCDYACLACLTEFEEARWPANADCEAHTVDWRARFLELRAAVAELPGYRNHVNAMADRASNVACIDYLIAANAARAAARKLAGLG